jgi:putative Mg2+ transporter-C (MgtC) family protein
MAIRHPMPAKPPAIPTGPAAPSGGPISIAGIIQRSAPVAPIRRQNPVKLIHRPARGRIALSIETIPLIGGAEMILSTEDIVKILLAIFAGGVIGLEREFRDKAAGFRTLIFISAGAALFTVFSIKIGVDGDPGRIAAALVTGVGFLGAGVILREGGRVFGLTTAATIWYIAALGMGFGAGQYALSLTMTAVGLVVLWFFPALENRIDNIREEREFEIVLAYRPENLRSLEAAFSDHRIRIIDKKHHKSGSKITCVWKTAGAPASHERLVQTLLGDKFIESLRF